MGPREIVKEAIKEGRMEGGENILKNAISVQTGRGNLYSIHYRHDHTLVTDSTPMAPDKISISSQIKPPLYIRTTYAVSLPSCPLVCSRAQLMTLCYWRFMWLTLQAEGLLAHLWHICACGNPSWGTVCASYSRNWCYLAGNSFNSSLLIQRCHDEDNVPWSGVCFTMPDKSKMWG